MRKKYRSSLKIKFYGLFSYACIRNTFPIDYNANALIFWPKFEIKRPPPKKINDQIFFKSYIFKPYCILYQIKPKKLGVIVQFKKIKTQQPQHNIIFINPRWPPKFLNSGVEEFPRCITLYLIEKTSWNFQ